MSSNQHCFSHKQSHPSNSPLAMSKQNIEEAKDVPARTIKKKGKG